MSERPPDEPRKRPPTLLDQALHAADVLVNEVQHRMPPELVSQLRAGQRQMNQRISSLQSQLGRSATRAEVDRLARRVEELAAQMEALTRSLDDRAPRTMRTVRRGDGPRPPAAEPPARPRVSRGVDIAHPPPDAPPRRRGRRTAGPEEEGGPPRRYPGTRPRKPPEPPAG